MGWKLDKKPPFVLLAGREGKPWSPGSRGLIGVTENEWFGNLKKNSLEKILLRKDFTFGRDKKR